VAEAVLSANAEARDIEPVGIAIVGMGVAGRLGAVAAHESPFCRVVAVSDLDHDAVNAAAVQFGGRPVLNAADLCNASDVEAVYIATPTHMHLENARQFAEAGKHLLIEKPVVVDPDEGRLLVEIERATGVRVMAVNTRGRDAPVRAMARLVREGAVGRVRSLTNISYTSWMLRPRFDYELMAKLGGGVIFRQGPHQVEIARTILGCRPISVTTIASEDHTRNGAIVSYNALVEYPNGVATTLVYSGAGFFDSAELTFGVGETGAPFDAEQSATMHANRSWEMDKYGADAVQLRARALAAPVSAEPAWGFAGFTVVSGEDGDLRQSTTGVTVYDRTGRHEVRCLEEEGGLKLDFEEFYSALREGTKLEHDAAWGVSTVDVCHAMWESHAQRRRIVL
jgi:phthalate 4,5-cis-dihydrodiol dehydrogenase